MKIVSLVPSVTETLLSWNVVPAGCTRFCEQPSLVHVGGTKNPDIDRIVEIAPDLVVMDEEENRLEDYRRLVSAGIHVHVLAIRSIEDLDSGLGALAQKLGAHWDQLGPLEIAPVTMSAFVPIWRRPYMALGEPTYGASVLLRLGVVSIFADEGPYPQVCLEQAAARHPDLVLAPSEPYPFSRRHLSELEAVAPVVFIDGKDLFWWGARTKAAMSRLREALGSCGAWPDKPGATVT